MESHALNLRFQLMCFRLFSDNALGMLLDIEFCFILHEKYHNVMIYVGFFVRNYK